MGWVSRFLIILAVITGTGSLGLADQPGCIPDCEGKECGDDGCGGSCGECEPPARCVVDRCVKGCGGYKLQGDWDLYSCCYKGYALICGYDSKNHRYVWSIHKCKNAEECRWEDVGSMYLCDSSLPDYEDPSGRYPRECDLECVPDCAGKECGDDGCGGSCGQCKEGGKCIDGKCCYPSCEGKECGDDGCGGSCGECDPWSRCENGKCVHYYGCKTSPYPGCPDCACEKCVVEKDNACGTLEWYDNCVRLCRDECGGCKKCEPNCEGKECGDDGCGGQCGYCKPGEICKDGKCVKCVPDCTGKECGDDGCGGSCGECEKGVSVCGDDFKCHPCIPGCPEYAECGLGGCGIESCGECPKNFMCVEEVHGCYPCYPYCVDRECGDDGCGGSCGECGPCEECISHHCRKIPDCVPDQAEVAEEVPPEQGPEVAERPDVAEPVDRAEDVGKDVVELHDIKADSVEPSEDTSNPTPKDSSEQQDAPPPNDSSQDTHHPKPLPAKKSSGGCSPGMPVSPLPLGLLVALLLWRRKKET